jgi:hypothetical protein
MEWNPRVQLVGRDAVAILDLSTPVRSGFRTSSHRYYDPSTGRFLTRDPIKDGRNWYGYCENNPVSYIDPTGLTWYYDQATGDLWWDDPKTEEFDPVYKGTGFSGKKGKHRDNPRSQHKKSKGPIPKGKYTIGKRRKAKSNGKKLDNLPLSPASGNDMGGRSGFLIHGGSENGDPSEGCVILSKDLRDRIEKSGDSEFVVYDSSRDSVGSSSPSDPRVGKFFDPTNRIGGGGRTQSFKF